MPLTLTVNGVPHSLAVEPDTPLIYVLRNALGCYGAKLGCGLEQCGACVVLADGDAIFSCTTRAGDCEGKAIETLEGLAGEGGELQELQRAFLAENAAQCGYCIGGIIMRAKSLLAGNRRPTRDEICAALDDHLCRCGAQPRIIKAVQRAALALREP